MFACSPRRALEHHSSCREKRTRLAALRRVAPGARVLLGVCAAVGFVIPLALSFAPSLRRDPSSSLALFSLCAFAESAVVGVAASAYKLQLLPGDGKGGGKRRGHRGRRAIGDKDDAAADSDVLVRFRALVVAGDRDAEAAHRRFEQHEDMAVFVAEARALLAKRAGGGPPGLAAAKPEPPASAWGPPPPPPPEPASPPRSPVIAPPSRTPPPSAGLPPGLGSGGLGASPLGLPPGLVVVAARRFARGAGPRPRPGPRRRAAPAAAPGPRQRPAAGARAARGRGRAAPPAPEPADAREESVEATLRRLMLGGPLNEPGDDFAALAEDVGLAPKPPPPEPEPEPEEAKPAPPPKKKWEPPRPAHGVLGASSATTRGARFGDRKDVAVGLFRVGASTNDAAIVVKRASGNCEQAPNGPLVYRGAIDFFAPRAAGSFVLRLLDAPDDNAANGKASPNVYATSDQLDVVVRSHDELLDSLKVTLTQLEEKGRSKLGAVAQLAVVAETLPETLAPRGGGRAGAGDRKCREKLRLCVARVLEELDRHVPGPYGVACRRRAGELEAPESDAAELAASRDRAESTLSEADFADFDQALKDKEVKKAKAKAAEERKARDVHGACRKLFAALSRNRSAWALLAASAPDLAEAVRRKLDVWDALAEEFWPDDDEGVSALARAVDRGDAFYRPAAPQRRETHAAAFAALDRACARVLPTLFPGAGFFDVRERARHRVERALNAADVLGGGLRLELRVFGSSANLFGADGADLDMCVCPLDPTNPNLRSPGDVIRRVGAVLEAAGAEDVNVRDTARVPIVLFRDPVSGLDCDVSTHNPLALQNTALLRAYAKVDGRVRGLAYVVKRWAKARAINSPSDGTLSSYGYVLCVLYYLQTVPQPPLLPSLQRLDRCWPRPRDPAAAPPPVVAHPFDASRVVQLAFHEPSDASLPQLRAVAARNTQSLGELAAGFFRHFAWAFDFKHSVVSPRTALPMPKANKAELEVWPMHSCLAIEDPFETYYDVAHVLKYAKHQTVHKEEFMRASGLIDAVAAGGDAEALLETICAPKEAEEPAAA
ncbi:RNA uridylyltransferase [Aureococcus anophagefferens]|nr:RNA uridylyltransferase [Aureococcus anophagefferens]